MNYTFELNFYYGIIGYTDLCLLSPSCSGLQTMVDIVRTYCEENGIKISVNRNGKKSKTKCMLFNSKLQPAAIRFYGFSLPYVEKWVHLGTIIHRDERSEHDILKSRGEFIGSIHSLYQELGRINPLIFETSLYLSVVTLWLRE